MHDDDLLLRRIAAAPALSGILREVFEFDVEDLASVDGSTARLSSGENLRLIACDGTMGRFFLVGQQVPRPVLYATSEGSAGLVGSSVAGALAMMVALPNWYDVLGFSAGGDLGQMRRAHAWLEEGMRHAHPRLDELQTVLSSELGLSVPDDPVMALWDSVRTMDSAVDFTDDSDGGMPWGSLFGEFTIERLMRL